MKNSTQTQQKVKRKIIALTLFKYISVGIIGFVLGVSNLGVKTWQFYTLFFLIFIYGKLYGALEHDTKH